MSEENAALLQLDLTPGRVICARHGEVFKHRWPTGYLTFATTAFECACTQQEFMDEIEQRAEVMDVPHEVQAIHRLLDEKPLCCRLPPNDLLEVYQEVYAKANVWPVDICSLCGKRGLGAFYRKAPPAAGDAAPAGHWPHICLRCVCHAPTQPVRGVVSPWHGLN